MEHELDVRGLHCPIPLIRAKLAWPHVAPGDTLVVLATDPEAPIDLAAFAADQAAQFTSTASAGEWRLVLRRAD